MNRPSSTVLKNDCFYRVVNLTLSFHAPPERATIELYTIFTRPPDRRIQPPLRLSPIDTRRRPPYDPLASFITTDLTKYAPDRRTSEPFHFNTITTTYSKSIATMQ